MGKPDADGPEVPDLPPEWGRVVVPDDASALAAEAARLRRELRATPRRAGGVVRGRPSLALPLVVLLVAVLTTLAGLAAVTWPRSGRATPEPLATPYSPPSGRPLPALDLVDAGQSPVPLRGLVPAMIIMIDGCPCRSEVADAAALAPPGVTLVTVAAHRAVPATPPVGGAAPRELADPAGGLRAFLHLPARPGTATALLVDRAGILVKVVPEVRSTEDYRADLARLAA
ncbi:hypothetical protein [Micromonospora sp. KLBMP9576]|uniref:hypothetical protein n=1 Tax=Micromonospora sp. KLBMP9576 TaxID=3424769 RepID=UPI003D923595